MTTYSKKGHYYIEAPRFELKHLLPLLPSAATVLDIGAGNGNNTKFLLEKGYNVTAVEPNPYILKPLRLLQQQYPTRLKIIEGSLDSYAPKEKFDVIVCCMVVHFINDRPAGIQAIHNMQAWTQPSGFNLVTGYLDGQSLSADYTFLLDTGELSKLYDNWTIRWYQESHRLTLSNIHSLRDVSRWALGRRGFKAARIIAQNL